MKKILTSIIFALSAISANAQETTVQVEMPCYPSEQIMSGLKGYKEQPLLSAKTDNDVMFVLFTNSTTRTWTIIGFDSNMKVGCVIGVGTGFKFMGKDA